MIEIFEICGLFGYDDMVVAGRIFMPCVATYALLDSRATHSFISETFVKKLRILPENMELGLELQCLRVSRCYLPA